MKSSAYRRGAAGLAAIACTVGSFSLPAVAHANVTRTAGEYTGTVTAGSQVSESIPYLRYGNTNFVGVWYIQKLLGKFGIASHWNGHALTVEDMPSSRPVTMNVDGTQSSSRVLTMGGVSYVNVSSTAASMGWRAAYQASSRQLEVQSSQGNETAAATARSAANTLHPHIPSIHLHAVAVGETRGSFNAVSGTSQSSPVLNTPILQAHGTSFAGVWYLRQWLKQLGYTTEWQHASMLNVDALPQIVHSAQVKGPKQTVSTALLQYQGEWYAPTAVLNKATGWQTTVSGNQVTVDGQAGQPSTTPAPVTVPLPQGTWTLQQDTVSDSASGLTVSGQLTGSNVAGGEIAFLQPSGTVRVVSADASGAFQATLGGESAIVIGVRTEATGWVGATMAVSAANAQNLQVSTAGATSHLAGTVVAGAGESLPNQTLELRNDITHSHYYVNLTGNHFVASVPAGPYDVWAVQVNGRRMFLGQRFLAEAGNDAVKVSLPTLPTASSVSIGSDAEVVAEPGVTHEQLESAAAIVQRVLPYDIASTGLHPDGKIQIHLYPTTSAYTEHFAEEGYAASDAQDYGQDSQAVTEGSQSVSVNLQGLSYGTGVNVLAHELTHALIYTVSRDIPDWVNEGLAWHQGIGAQADGSPSQMLWKSLQWQQWVDIVTEQSKGSLYPLGGTGSLNPAYNVEAQDYYAVQQLIDQYGMQRAYQFVRQIDSLGDSPAFAAAFGESEAEFESQVSDKLSQTAAQSNHGVAVTVRATQPGITSLFVSNPSGGTTWYSGVTAGQDYTFICHADGTVTAPAGLTQTETSTNTGDGTWYLGANAGYQQGILEVDNAFNLGFLEAQAMFLAGSNTAIVHVATDLPIGLTLVSLVPGQS